METHETNLLKTTKTISVDPTVWKDGQDFIDTHNRDNDLQWKRKVSMSQFVEDLIQGVIYERPADS